MSYHIHAGDAAQMIRGKLSHVFGVTPDQASDEFFYKATAMVVRDLLTGRRDEFVRAAQSQRKKQVYYLSMEFLLGRSLKNSLFNLGLTEEFAGGLSTFGVKLERLYEQEPDAGLGNGGLGRLAACYLDALATGDVPAVGHSIRYEYGIFRQKLVDGWQTEMPDFWLPGGDVWLAPRPEEAVEVHFDGVVRESWDGPYHSVKIEGYSSVQAIPYDMMISGYGGNGVSLLRLWRAKAPGLDMKMFNEGDYMRAIEQNAMAEVITKILYPSDNHPEGKALRLRQQYFLVSAAIQSIVSAHLKNYGTLDDLPDRVAIHINDTHPTLAIPELMRIMLDECGYGWDAAYGIVCRTFAYTNHTVMREALECWNEGVFADILPRIHQIVREIDNRFRASVWEQTHDAGMVADMAVIEGGAVRMANLCAAVCHSVNGVSKLHSNILKKTVFYNFNKLEPAKFTSVTNGIAYRRWLHQANPTLASFVRELTGDDCRASAEGLHKLRAFEQDGAALEKLGAIKRQNKENLAKYLRDSFDVTINPDSIFDMQLKRLHEYKRQHLNVLHILAQYNWLKDHPGAPFIPRTYIFGAKAAPGYFLAKQIIQMIVSVGKMIDADPAARDLLKVVFVEDYRVTLSELLTPAAEISEQISLAGTEASGTSNMKFMLSGAVTLGTDDGANVEIHGAVGSDNILIFGLTASEVEETRRAGYDPRRFYNNSPQLRAAADMLQSGVAGQQFPDIYASLMGQDPYMVMADFRDYMEIQGHAAKLYTDAPVWNRISLINIAEAGLFSADRAIAEYCQNIWDVTPTDYIAKENQ